MKVPINTKCKLIQTQSNGLIYVQTNTKGKRLNNDERQYWDICLLLSMFIYTLLFKSVFTYDLIEIKCCCNYIIKKSFVLSNKQLTLHKGVLTSPRV